MIIRRLIPCILLNSLFRFHSTSSESINQLIKTLNNRGDYKRAFELFDLLIKENNVTIVSLLNIVNTCIRSGQIERIYQIEKLIDKSNQWKYHIPLQTSLINIYMKYNIIQQAEEIFEKISQLPQCDIIVYNAMLKGYIQNRKAERCFQLIDKMPSKILPDNVTYTLLLNACSILRDEKRGIKIHNELSLLLDNQHVHLQNALIDFYGKINQITKAEQIFDDMNIRETSSFNSLMKAYLVNNMPFKVLQLFEQMKKSNQNIHQPLTFKPDLITFMAICDACQKLGLLNTPHSSYGEFNWKKIFSTTK